MDAAFQPDLDFQGWVPPGIKDFARPDFCDRCKIGHITERMKVEG
jgi:hypothetical protein